MTVLAITRGGFGGVWKFDDFESADLHPMIQYGDAILREPADAARLYTRPELELLLGRLGLERLSLEIRNSIVENGDWRRWQQAAEKRMDPVWDALLVLAADPPTDPRVVFEKIREDRMAMKTQEMPRMAKKNNAEETTSGGDVGENAEKKTRAPRASTKYGDNDVIHMGSDKDGNLYGADNNPKRAGSAAAERFGKLRDGMTAGEFAEAVGDKNAAYADLVWGESHGQLTVERKSAETEAA